MISPDFFEFLMISYHFLPDHPCTQNSSGKKRPTNQPKVHKNKKIITMHQYSLNRRGRKPPPVTTAVPQPHRSPKSHSAASEPQRRASVATDAPQPRCRNDNETIVENLILIYVEILGMDCPGLRGFLKTGFCLLSTLCMLRNQIIAILLTLGVPSQLGAPCC